MDNILDFSEEEIEQQLASLGYKDIPKHRLRQFKQDLDELIRHEKSKSHDESSFFELNSYTLTSQPSPPAVIKEKVNQSYIADPGDGFFLHSGNPDRDRQVLMPCQNQYNGTRMDGYCDSYAQHSVAPKSTRPSSAPTSLEVEPGPTDTRYTFSQTSTPDRDTGQVHGRNFIKRKVLRKHKGQRVVCDESVHSEELDAVSGLEERLGGLHVSMPTQENSEPESEDSRSQSDEQSSENDGLSAFEAYIRGMSRMQTHHDFKPKPKSFIRPARGHPHTRNLKKNDPVTKYFEYKQHWETFKLPGERDRKVLHREIREQLAYQPPRPKPRKVYVPNTYVVPTEKKRTALRWEIRNDLANGLVPPRLNYRF